MQGMDERTITREEVRRLAGFFNIEEAAVLVGMAPRRFRYQVERGLIVRPSVRIGSKARCYYSREDVECINNILHQ